MARLQTVDGVERLYVTTTTTHEVCTLDPGLQDPDNLAVDHDGNIYTVEDRNGGVPVQR